MIPVGRDCILHNHRHQLTQYTSPLLSSLADNATGRCGGRAGSGAGPGEGTSPPLHRLLRTVRDAWPECRSLFDPQQQPQPQRSSSWLLNVYRNDALWRGGESGACEDIMLSHSHVTHAFAGAAPPRPDASPGLLRRRYSVPETIMRKYRVAQQRADCEESGGSTSRGSAGSLPTRALVPSRLPRDREVMRKSALLRRLWGRAPPCCRYCSEEMAARYSRSLDGSHSELRRTPAELSLSTYRSHARADLELWNTDVRVPSLSGEITSVSADTRDDFTPNSFYVDLLPSSKPATRDDVGGSESRKHAFFQTSEDDFESKLSITSKTPPSCEMLEIVVTESSEACARPGQATAKLVPNSSTINIDEYVSSVLVESLNSLTDRLELVTSRVPGDGKISVIEKEIKVKLQSTGVNTIVHLSPTSNNQIIFGNEELCDGSEESRAGLRVMPYIRDEPPGAESDDVVRSARARSGTGSNETFGGHEDVNRSVLHQIQKLFQEEMRDLDPGLTYAAKDVPSISHIEISNVSNADFLFNDGTTSHIPCVANEGDPGEVIFNCDPEILSGIGVGNYFETAQIGVTVPRFTALPHTASMEVNASSEEAELVGSDCTSLVDSLDDPNSPRGVLLRRAFTDRRTELVRSAVNVLDLLPETKADNVNVHQKESEYFYIGIEDNDCCCEKENVNVADRMPEKIKQRLYRRHRRRQLRMENAKRSRVKEHRREFQKYGLNDADRKKNVERDCAAIIDALINDVISKIVQDEYKYARIKRRSERSAVIKSSENSSKKNLKKPSDTIVATSTGSTPTRPSVDSINHGSTNNKNDDHNAHRMHQIRGKLSLLTRPALPVDDEQPRRVYQKSEIREGNNCIEILEILEYVNGDRSSPNTSGTTEYHGFGTRSSKKSRIPIPVHEKTPRQLRSSSKIILSSDSTSTAILSNSTPETTRPRQDGEELASSPARRVSLPHTVESRPRSGSMRFRRVFDVIPEERSSFGVESSNDDTDRSDIPVLAPATKSVATSPHACQVTIPLRVKVGEGRVKKARPRAARRDEGIQEKTDSIRTEVTRSTTILNPSSKDENSNCSQKLTTERAIQRKLNRVKSDSRETRVTAPDNLRLSRGYNTENHGRTKGCDNLKTERSRSDDEPNESEEEEESSSSGESVVCPLAPRWLAAPARRRRARKTVPPHARAPAPDPGEWSVTVAGSCRAALPADVEMRLRFPRCVRRSPRRTPRTPRSRRTSRFGSRCASASCQAHECTCSRRSGCANSARMERSASPRSHCVPVSLPAPRRPALMFTLKKEARDSSVLASKSMKKSIDSLPDLETFSSSHSKMRSSVKAVVSDATGMLPAVLGGGGRRRARTAQGE